MVVKSLKCLYRSPVPCYVTGWYLIFNVVTLTNILVTWPWHVYTGTCHAIFDTWYPTSVLSMLYLPPDIGHRYLPCYICQWYQTTVLAMLYLTHDTGHRYLPRYIWHMIPDTGTCHAILATWYRTPVLAMLYLPTWYRTPVLAMLYLTHDTGHRYLPCYIWHMISDTGTCHAIFDTWYRTSVLAMLCLTLDIWHRFLTCYTCHLIYDTGTWHMLSPSPSTLDLILWPLIGYYYTWYLYYRAYYDYHFYRDLAWLLYYYQTSGTPVLLNSCTLHCYSC